jgi:hypothetical protein
MPLPNSQRRYVLVLAVPQPTYKPGKRAHHEQCTIISLGKLCMQCAGACKADITPATLRSPTVPP